MSGHPYHPVPGHRIRRTKEQRDQGIKEPTERFPAAGGVANCGWTPQARRRKESWNLAMILDDEYRWIDYN